MLTVRNETQLELVLQTIEHDKKFPHLQQQSCMESCMTLNQRRKGVSL